MMEGPKPALKKPTGSGRGKKEVRFDHAKIREYDRIVEVGKEGSKLMLDWKFKEEAPKALSALEQERERQRTDRKTYSKIGSLSEMEKQSYAQHGARIFNRLESPVHREMRPVWPIKSPPGQPPTPDRYPQSQPGNTPPPRPAMSRLPPMGAEPGPSVFDSPMPGSGIGGGGSVGGGGGGSSVGSIGSGQRGPQADVDMSMGDAPSQFEYDDGSVKADVECWHLKPDHCIYQRSGEHSSPVVSWKGRIVVTASGNRYRLLAIDPQIEAVLNRVGIPFDADNPLADTEALFYAERVVYQCSEQFRKIGVLLRDINKKLAEPRNRVQFEAIRSAFRAMGFPVDG